MNNVKREKKKKKWFENDSKYWKWNNEWKQCQQTDIHELKKKKKIYSMGEIHYTGMKGHKKSSNTYIGHIHKRVVAWLLIDSLSRGRVHLSFFFS